MCRNLIDVKRILSIFPLETTVTLQDVNILLGLRVDGPAVTCTTKYNWADLCEDLLGIRPVSGDLHG